jgi:hypothetical protein
MKCDSSDFRPEPTVRGRGSALNRLATLRFMSYHCPKCGRVIYNRRLNPCGYCGAALPPELLFSPAEIEVLDKNAAEHTAEQQRIRAQLAAEESEHRKAAQNQGTMMMGYFVAGG